MAIKVGNIPAFDQYPTVGIGLSVPFQSTATSGSDAIFNINYTTAEQVKYNLINYFLTSKGEVQHFVELIPSANDIFIQAINKNS